MSRIELDDPRLTAYVLGELAPEDLAAVEAAATADPALRAQIESLRETTGLLAAELSREPFPELTPAQRAQVVLRAAVPPASWRWGTWLGYATAGMCVLLIASVSGVSKYTEFTVASPTERARAAAPEFDTSSRNPYALLPKGQSPADRQRVERELAPRPAPPPPADLRRNAVDVKTPHHGLRGAAGEIHAWVRGGGAPAGNRLRSHNDYSYDYTRGNPAGGYSTGGFDRHGFNREGFDRRGLDSQGYDRVGLDRDGYDRSGYDREGYDRRGYDRDGYDRRGHDSEGRDHHGDGRMSNDAAAASAGMNDALKRYTAAEARGDQAAAARALADYTRHRDGLRGLRSTEPAFEPLTENAFLAARENPLSTFSIDVDTASYSKVRRYLTEGSRPPADAVRVEELINYFPYAYPEPDAGEPLTIAAEIAGAPWAPGHRLVRVALKARSVAPAQRPASNLVFLIDVSGSMDQPDRLPLVQRSLELLVPQLSGEDRVAIVVYAGSSGLVLPSTPGDRKATITQAIRDLRAGGSTNGGAGIELAYRTAREAFIKGGNNRVVLATDGDFNVGVTSRDALEKLIREKAKDGVFLTVLGYGMGDHQDATLERLADRGNGNHAYIDTLLEAHKVLVEQMAGTLVAVARDVKIQVAFEPAQVRAWRLIGYENRALEAQDFTDDTKDAGELGAGHTVTALYEIESAAQASAAPMLTVKVRFQPPAGGASRELSFPVTDRGTAFEAAGLDFRWAAAVAGFGMELRGSKHRGGITLDQVRTIAEAARGADPTGYRAEFIELVKRATR